ncbi:phage tail protein [Sphingomonas faeni]|uniref:phage tail protein n=1 Tax=Sphingomonas faeni TaxID=185950 RepID=UPI00334AE24B
MSDAFLGEIRMFGGSYAPVNWALCNGGTLQISDNDALFSLLGTTYGGDGVSTFMLPDLRGRLPIHQGGGPGLTPRVIGTVGGTETVTLTIPTIPGHIHSVVASTSPGTLDGPTPTALPATPTGGVSPFLYVVPGSSTVVPGPMAPSSIGAIGSNMPHSNLMPSQCVTFIIAVGGLFPSRN